MPAQGTALPSSYTALGLRTKCRTSEIRATTSSMWISPLATWKTVNPIIHAINNTMKRIVKMLMVSPPFSPFGPNSIFDEQRHSFRCTP